MGDRQTKRRRRLACLQGIHALQRYVDGADVIDVKRVEGRNELRTMLAAMLSYYPWWVVRLYRLRKLLVGLLGLAQQAAPVRQPALKPEDVAFTPGAAVTFFTVRAAKEGRYWIAETPPDKHLRSYFGVVSDPIDGSRRRFTVITTVFYKHWTGPVYFNLIRPFHHLVVASMARHGATTSSAVDTQSGSGPAAP